MERYIYLVSEGKVVEKSECSYRIRHNGEVVAVVSSEDAVWRWVLRKRDEIERAKLEIGQRWWYRCIGVFGLVMENRNGPDERLEWTVETMLTARLAKDAAAA